MSNECNADLGHPCDGGGNGDPCNSCSTEIAYWCNQWERYGKREMRGKEMREQYEADIRDVYSCPTDRHKLISMLGEEL